MKASGGKLKENVPEVSYLVTFITSAQRGVILRRPSKRVDDLPEPE